MTPIGDDSGDGSYLRIPYAATAASMGGLPWPPRFITSRNSPTAARGMRGEGWVKSLAPSFVAPSDRSAQAKPKPIRSPNAKTPKTNKIARASRYCQTITHCKTWHRTRRNQRHRPPPDWMSETGRQEWIRCVGHPVIGRLLSALHKGTFEHYCVLYDRFVKDATGTEPMKASDRAAFHSLCMQLGFTPAAQSKVSMPTERKPQSAWDLLTNM